MMDKSSTILLKESINKYAYYIMILLIALLAVFVPPLCLGAISGDFGFAFPDTPSAWVVWGIINGSSIIANISILVLFKLQAKKNCLEHPNYIKATKILDEVSKVNRVYIPRSPSRMDIDDVPIKANMTHSEWKSIDSICMISMILPSLSNKTMAL